MSSMEMSLVLEDVARGATVRRQRPVLRLALLQGEVLRLPRRRRTVRVLSGTAWITCSGLDITLERGALLELPARSDCALVSALGTGALLFEVW